MDWHTPSTLDQKQYNPADVFTAGLRLHHIANTAYPIAHLTTMRSYLVPRSLVQSEAPQAWEGIEQLALYVHVPMCEARCGFCEYTVLDPGANAGNEASYFELLLREFELWREAIDTPAKTLIGFDIGGGTPSLPAVAHIASVVQAARHNFRLPAEVVISIETTPKIAANQPEKMRAFYDLGIRRISMGVQTVNTRLLQAVGRSATSVSYNLQAVENIRAAGFERFNIDVMYGFANQSLEGLEVTLKHVVELEPEYVTLYRMRYKGTRMAAQAQAISRDQVYSQAELAKAMLQAAGYEGAPGKNTFSRLEGDPGTSDYLTRRVIEGAPYLGLGLGAQSLSHQTLSYNAGAADKRLVHYQRQVRAGRLPIQDLYHLSPQAAMGKMISVSFYFGAIDLPSFQAKFGLALEQAFPAEVDFLLREGLMEYRSQNGHGQPSALCLTGLGEQRVNGVMALFYAGAVKEHLLSRAKAGQGL